MKGKFSNLINSDTPVLVDFYADWCQPCKVQSPVLHELASELPDLVKIIKINVDINQSIAARYQIQSIPTLVLFRQGQIVWRQSGVVSKQQLKSVILSYS